MHEPIASSAGTQSLVPALYGRDKIVDAIPAPRDLNCVPCPGGCPGGGWLQQELIHALLKLFSAIISPILLYCCEVWSPYLFGKIDRYEKFKSKIFAIKNDIEKLHIKFCKRILGVHSKSTNLAVYTRN